jgi:hypothetical protein
MSQLSPYPYDQRYGGKQQQQQEEEEEQNGDNIYNAVVRYIPPPAGHAVDAEGRLLKDAAALIDPDELPEDINVFVKDWRDHLVSYARDWEWTSKIVWPDFPNAVKFRKLDIYERDQPHLHIGTFDEKDSYEIRWTPGWKPVRSVFFVDTPGSYTFELQLESAGPPRRSRFIPKSKTNNRDLSKWLGVGMMLAFHGPTGAPGTTQFYVDYADLPDRYFLSSLSVPALGYRRLFRFAAYSTTQYYILAKRIVHPDLDGGSGMTYYVEAGPIVQARKHWRLIGSFYGFDAPLPGSTKFTIFRKLSPFPHMQISIEPILRAHEWDNSLQFYAFDVPVPCTNQYSLQHCLRSITSLRETLQRHRLTTESPTIPWEFRLNLFAIPAKLHDCTVVPYHAASSADFADQFGANGY